MLVREAQLLVADTLPLLQLSLGVKQLREAALDIRAQVSKVRGLELRKEGRHALEGGKVIEKVVDDGQDAFALEYCLLIHESRS